MTFYYKVIELIFPTDMEIKDIIKHAKEYAIVNMCVVKFEHNSIEIKVWPDRSIPDEKYIKEYDRKRLWGE